MRISDFRILQKIVQPYACRNMFFWRPVTGFSLDTRTIRRGDAYIAIKGRHVDGHRFIREAVERGASLIIAQRYVKLPRQVPFFIVSDTMRVLPFVCRFIQEYKNPVVCAITGSVGKTTTKEMLAYILRGKAPVCKNVRTENNILGIAKTMFRLRDEKILVLEMGSNHAGEIRTLVQAVVPAVAAVTFIKPVHLEGFRNMAGVRKEKLSIFTHPQTVAVLNGDDPYCMHAAHAKPPVYFGTQAHNALRAAVETRGSRICTYRVNNRYTLRLRTPFAGFIYNALAAIACARVCGVTTAQAIARLNKFRVSCQGRMEIHAYRNGKVINDAYNANPYAVQEALRFLRGCAGRKMFVLGDMRELGTRSVRYHQELVPSIVAAGVEVCATMGVLSKQVYRCLRASGMRVFHGKNQQEIARFICGCIAEDARPWVVLLKGSRSMGIDTVERYMQECGIAGKK